MAFVSTFTPTVLTTCTSILSSTCSSFCKQSITTSRRVRNSNRVIRSQTESPETSSKTSTSNENGADGLKYDDEEVVKREVILDENIVGFCSIDPGTGKRLELSIREKESLFLDAMQSYFRGGQTLLSNDEFDTLKEELTWQGSEVVTLSRDEFKFLDAAKAYEQGKSTMSNEEFDKLKKKLFEQGSVVAIARGPRCSIQRKITFSDVIPDKKRTLALFIPAGLLFSLTWLSFAYELTPLHQVDPVVSLLIGSPVIFILARLITGIIVPKAEIMVGDCPSCGRRTHVLFGNVLNKEGFSSEAEVKCGKCKAELLVERDSCRMILVKEGS